MNRRGFFKVISTFLLFFQFIFLTKRVLAKKPDTSLNLIDEQDTLAKAMQYRHNAGKASAARTNKKAFCYNCSKYNLCMDGDTVCKPLTAEILKKAQAAPCQIFKGKNVSKNGWCLSWDARS